MYTSALLHASTDCQCLHSLYSAQVQMSWPTGVDPAEEKFLGMPSNPDEQEAYVRNWNFPMTTKSKVLNDQLRTQRIPYQVSPGSTNRAPTEHSQ